MSAELIQLAYYAAFIILGWYLRHQGFLKPTPPPTPSPTPNPGPIPMNQAVLIDLLKQVLDRLLSQQQQQPPPAAEPKQSQR